MLSWVLRRHARIERIHSEAEAEALIHDFGEAAYYEARQRQHEASSDAIATDWGLVALAVARQIGSRPDVEPQVRLAMNAVLVPDRADAASRRRRSRVGLATRKPRSLPGSSPADELARVIAATTNPFRIKFVGSAGVIGSTTLKEVEIEVADVSAAIVAAANIAWPPRTIGLRIFDHEGREVFARQKGRSSIGFAPPRGRQWAFGSAVKPRLSPTAGADVERALRIATANDANVEVSGPCP